MNDETPGNSLPHLGDREPVDDLLCFSEPYARVELPIALDRLDLPALPYQCCHIFLGSWRCLAETVATPELPGVVQLASRQEQPCGTEECLPEVSGNPDDDPGHAPGSQNAAKPVKPACPVSVRPRRSAFRHRRKIPRSARSKRSFGRCADRIDLARVTTVRCLGPGPATFASLARSGSACRFRPAYGMTVRGPSSAVGTSK
jgi:hypothetical protein